MDVIGSIIISVGTGFVVGVVLWAALPRGVVLTRSFATGPDGHLLPETWTIRNESALPVQIIGVTYQGIGTMNFDTEKFEELPLPVFEPDGSGVRLTFDDEVSEIRRVDTESPWAGLKIGPGDTLTAHVGLNTTLTIKYRRAGILGLTEKRTVTVDGGV